LDAFQGHWHEKWYYTGITGAAGNAAIDHTVNESATQLPNARNAIRSPITDGTNGTPRTASETRPVNTTIRIWQRTGGTLTTTAGTSVTSGIYDSGTNSNGSWIRFTDGTMMQWGTFASTTYPQAMSFPISFVDTTYRLIPAHSETSTANIVSNINPTSITVSGCSVWSNVGSTAAQRLSGSVDWQATGKWK